MTTRLIPIAARGNPDHRRVEVSLSLLALLAAEKGVLHLSPADARRTAQRLVDAADMAERKVRP